MTKEYVVESLMFREISIFTSLHEKLSVRNLRSGVCLSVLKYTTFSIIYDEKKIHVSKLVKCFAKFKFPELLMNFLVSNYPEIQE